MPTTHSSFDQYCISHKTISHGTAAAPGPEVRRECLISSFAPPHNKSWRGRGSQKHIFRCFFDILVSENKSDYISANRNWIKAGSLVSLRARKSRCSRNYRRSFVNTRQTMSVAHRHLTLTLPHPHTPSPPHPTRVPVAERSAGASRV